MAEKICLDTSICIELMKNSPKAVSVFRSNSRANTFIPSMAAFELLLRTYNMHVAYELISSCPILGFDLAAAAVASRIEKNLQKSGKLIGRNDIFIAATAIVNGCAVATLNVKDFSKIEGLRVVGL